MSTKTSMSMSRSNTTVILVNGSRLSRPQRLRRPLPPQLAQSVRDEGRVVQIINGRRMEARLLATLHRSNLTSPVFRQAMRGQTRTMAPRPAHPFRLNHLPDTHTINRNRYLHRTTSRPTAVFRDVHNRMYPTKSSTKTLGVLPSPTISPTGSASSIYENARSTTTLNDQYSQHPNAGRSTSRDPSHGKKAQGSNGESSNSYGASQGSAAAEHAANGCGNPQFTINGSSISSYGGQPLASHGSNIRDSSATRQSDGGMQSDSSGDYSRADSGISVDDALKPQLQSNQASNNGQQQQQQRRRNSSSTRAASRDELQQQGKAKYQQGGLQGTGGFSWLSNRNSGDSSSSGRPDSARKSSASWAQLHSPPDPLYNPPDTAPYFHSIGGVSSTSCTGPLSTHEAAPSPSVNRDQSFGRRWFG
ncbi:hypothetical protein EJ03DRAFT_169806 [Teratosphaeria nubilosa]|uniref:Uncharacterized protein n=1 Tax=Teratosphaeria nubilosa TaxID=161662 RepID=A0A6G1LIQ8_9PEZI|nr:hypothetical protein EJ03DRAFT_169806 [Teratosphaeria nubilosa]